MIQVWVCDENKDIALLIFNFVRRAFRKRGIKILLDVYYSGAELLDSLKKGDEQPDIIFMAVKMKSTSGFFIAEEMLKMHCPALLVFVSAYAELLYESLKYMPFACVVKKSMNTEIEYVITLALLALNLGVPYSICVKSGRRRYLLPLNDLKAVYCMEKKLIFVLKNEETLVVRESLSKVYERLKEYGFIKVSRSMIINLLYVRAYSGDRLIFVDGTYYYATGRMLKELF